MKQVLFLMLFGIATFALTSCVKDEEDPDYASYQTKTAEETSADAQNERDVKAEEKLLADASRPIDAATTPVEKVKNAPITLSSNKEVNASVETPAKSANASPKTEVPASELRREAAPTGKVTMPAPVMNERGADKMIAKGAEEPRIVRGTGTNKPTPVVSEPTISQPVTLRGKTAVFSVDKANHEFGFIDEGTKITHVYTIKNTGGTDLYINDVKPSCNCTVPDFSIESVPPGGSTSIKLVFDSNGKVGTQRKTATVMTNIGEYELTMTGTVRPKSKNY